MWKIGHFYIVPKLEMETINWWLTLLDRHREQDKKEYMKQHEKDTESDL